CTAGARILVVRVCLPGAGSGESQVASPQGASQMAAGPAGMRRTCRTRPPGGARYPPRGIGAAWVCHHARNMHLPRILGGALGGALLLSPAAHAAVLDQHDGIHITARDGTVLWNRYEQ